MIEKIRQSLKVIPDGCAALITAPENIFYLSGFLTDSGSLLLTHMGIYFFTDGRYYESAKKVIGEVFAGEYGADVMQVVLIKKNYHEILDLTLKNEKVSKVYVESDHMTLETAANLMIKHKEIEFDSSSDLSKRLSYLRAVKTPEEIQKIQKAQKIADQAFNVIADDLDAGITEKQIANRMDYLLRHLGADSPAFPTIAASGPNSAIPHAVPTDRKIRKGDFLVLDFGARVGGYCSDTTRTLAIGEISEEQEKMYNVVMLANQDAQKYLKSGLTARAVDSIARHTLNVWGGLDEYFSHSLGHGVGINVHEAPTLSEKSRDTLEENMIVTIEPGIYIPGEFGIRIEDMFVVQKDGNLRFSSIPRTLRIIKTLKH